MLSLSRSTLARSFTAQTRIAGVRFGSTKTIHDVLAEVIPERQEYAKKIKAEHGNKVIGNVTVEQVFGGMRGVKAMLWEPSVLDSEEGIRFWGKSIPECQAVLPTAKDGKEMLPEAMFWYLLTSKVPTEAESLQFQNELASRAPLSKNVEAILDALPTTLHPMSQFIIGVTALNEDSAFARKYTEGMKKTEYWKPTLEDSLDCVAKCFTIAARIYRNTYLGGVKDMPALQADKDLSWNFANQIGFGDSAGFIDVIRLYNALHTDHEGGNVSAHTAHLVGSALSDPFLSYAAALAGLAGPLHGLANQEVLRFILDLQKEYGAEFSDETLKEALWKHLKTGVVPGYGHAVLRKPDPRFTALNGFANARPEVAKDPVVKIVNQLFKIAPGVLTEHGKTKNPHPNVDSASGSLLYHYGLTQFPFYTVTFGTSRSMGALAQLVWDRALGLPLERPKSLNMEAIEALAKKA